MNVLKKNKYLSSGDKGTVANNEDRKVVTLLLADEVSTIKQKQRALFESEPDLKIIGDVNNGLDALDAINVFHPDILVLGLQESNLLEVVQMINQRFPKTGIIVPYKQGNEANGQAILRAGLHACILRSASSLNLLHAIREWGQNKIHLGSSVYKENARDFSKHNVKSTIDSFEVLTSREREVFNLVTQGLTNAQIATLLSISRRTVEVHRANMLRKLGLHNQQEQLIKYAIERDIKLEPSNGSAKL